MDEGTSIPVFFAYLLLAKAHSLPNVLVNTVFLQACMVEDGSDPCDEVLTFLYKLASGACPKSYGFHAALLAGVEDKIVKLAHAKAAELENMKAETTLFKYGYVITLPVIYFNFFFDFRKLFNENFRCFQSLMSTA